MQGENERQWKKKKVNENTYDISSLKTLRWLLRLFVIIDKNHKVVVIEKNCDSVHRQWIDYIHLSNNWGLTVLFYPKRPYSAPEFLMQF